MRIVVFCLLLLTVIACSPKRYVAKEVTRLEAELKEHTGFLLYDPVAKKTLIEHQSDRYFTPASNTKIFTFYSSIKLLGDSAVSIRYIQKEDSLFFWGAGDASFLYANTFDSRRLFDFLSASGEKKLFLSTSNFQTETMGPGWAWDDYPYYYSAERTPLPIYGNLVNIKKDADRFYFRPSYFQLHFAAASDPRGDETILRDIDSNQLTYYPGKKNNRSSWSIPFRYSDDLIVELLSDTLKRKVELINKPLPPDAKPLRSVPLDSLLRVMMHDSDNFIAEQLLLQCAAQVSDTLMPERAIEYAKKNFLADLPDEPQWVDGSGLSRYNLFTPRSIVKLWEKIYQEVPQERLFPLLATGGKSGTLKNSYKADKPYVYGKTGTLSNNHTLSGYLLTRKGRVLIFSMMNNNFIVPTSDVRKRMEKILYTIYERF
jgi:D-alanyl-D-alanine carboxypeptidase/D-alanyl-D-alanine-endopeptidase (penicillin-binding protein 4)